jgi:alkaline phosphatase D
LIHQTIVLQNSFQSILDLSVKNNFNSEMIKFALLILLLATSCQTKAPAPAPVSPLSSTQVLNNQVKSDKKRQSELDLPFRGFPIDQSLETIAFGSCADQDVPQPIWSTIEKNQPDLMIMLGNNVYASAPAQKPISEQYNKMKKITEYRSIREKLPFMAIWDDNDYGQNDAGLNNPEKEEARTQFLKNWPYLRTMTVDKSGALYHSKIFGEKKNTLQVILLDTRWDRSELKKNEAQTEEEKIADPRPYLPDDSKDRRILSESQWQWLESELKKPASFRIIGSPIQVIANDHHFEKWGNFPAERERLFSLLKKLKIKNAIFLSGDRQMAAIAKKEIAGLGTLLDITSSGLNKTAESNNKLSDESYLLEGYGLANFGLIKINWAERQAHIEIRSANNDIIQATDVKF